MGKTLVAYFSAGGNTADAAKIIADTLSADIYEITPKEKYTREDLNWRSKTSRTNVEMSDKSFRPAIESAEIDLTDVDTVFLGFPIWWYVAPTIVNTFLEANDFSGKRIVLFATSGGSGFGKTVQGLTNSVSKDTVIEEGRVFNAGFSPEDIAAFAKNAAE